ncbi:MAG: basic secretory family protein [Planctomycetaceae bacterium]|nr:basic secretory family protein [Planctomycetaceae bacterium]
MMKTIDPGKMPLRNASIVLTALVFHLTMSFVLAQEPTPPDSKEIVSRLEKVTVEIRPDVAEQEGIADWAEKARQLVVEWYPKMDRLLESDGFVPPKEVTLVFEKMDGVAGTAGNVIHISADWIKKQPDDFGMVAHELVHVIQSYPRRTGPGWVTEGIADYIRHAHYEPDAPMPRINPDRASYRDAYKTTAGFFIWIEKNYDKDFVKKLNVSMRDRTYQDDIFEKSTGKKLDDLWKEYADTFRKTPQREISQPRTEQAVIPHNTPDPTAIEDPHGTGGVCLDDR